ncbi:unnamed protein product [Orchesella dallaii]|uniref:Ionotropic glutamate receptor L-glutamate and glycine-binding domain-containing protein n=1 Tax=Orchesella dallaii TaxID=48710 RepID=A0ABP1PL47_9HEXA
MFDYQQMKASIMVSLLLAVVLHSDCKSSSNLVKLKIENRSNSDILLTSLLHHVAARTEATNVKCTLKYLMSPSPSHIHTDKLTLNWNMVEEFGKPYEYYNMLLHPSQSQTFNSFHVKFGSQCKTIIYLLNESDQIMHLSSTIIDDPVKNQFIFVALKKTTLSTILIQNDLINTLYFKFGLYLQMLPNGNPKIMYMLEPKVHNGDFVSASQPPEISKTMSYINGRTFHITAPTVAPFYIIRHLDDDQPLTFDGSHYELIAESSKILNYTAHHLLSKFRSSGGKLENGSWTGAMGDLISGRADISAAMGLSVQRYSMIYFSSPTSREDMIFSLTEPRPGVEWDALIKPLTPVVWVWTLLAFIAFAIMFYISSDSLQPQKGTTDNVSKSNDIAENLYNSIFLPFAIFLEEPFEKVSQNTAFRFTLIPWMLMSLIVSTGFRSNLVGFLTFPETQAFPTSFEALHLDKSYTVYFYSIGGVGLELMKTSKNPSILGLANRVIIEKNLEACLKFATAPKTVCIGWKSIIRNGIAKHLPSASSVNPLYVTHAPAAFSDVCIGFRKGFIFTGEFSQVAGYGRAGGLIEKWDKDFRDSEQRYAYKKALEAVDARKYHHFKNDTSNNNIRIFLNHDESFKPLTTENTAAIYMILIFGGSLSIVTFMLELVWAINRRRAGWNDEDSFKIISHE